MVIYVTHGGVAMLLVSLLGVARGAGWWTARGGACSRRVGGQGRWRGVVCGGQGWVVHEGLGDSAAGARWTHVRSDGV